MSSTGIIVLIVVIVVVVALIAVAWSLSRRAALRKNLIAILIYAVAIPIAYYRTGISLGLTFLVALIYAVPSLWVERCADILEGKDEHRAEQGTLHEPYTGPSAGHE